MPRNYAIHVYISYIHVLSLNTPDVEQNGYKKENSRYERGETKIGRSKTSTTNGRRIIEIAKMSIRWQDYYGKRKAQYSMISFYRLECMEVYLIRTLNEKTVNPFAKFRHVFFSHATLKCIVHTYSPSLFKYWFLNSISIRTIMF